MAMGKGREIGTRLQAWLAEGSAIPFSQQGLIGRMLDELGEDTSLQAPLRDLAMRPLFRQSLLQQQPALRQSAALNLNRELQAIYAPRVQAELQDLIEAALGVSLPRQAGQELTSGSATAEGGPGPGAAVSTPRAVAPEAAGASEAAVPSAAGDSGSTGVSSATAVSSSGAVSSSAAVSNQPLSNQPAGSNSRPAPDAAASATTAPLGHQPGPALPRATPLAAAWAPIVAWLADRARVLGPGLGLGAAMALVIAWLGGELDRLWLDRWPGAWALVLALLVLQALSLGPCKRWRRTAPLRLQQIGDPHQLGHWISAPWLHHRHGEAVLNALMLLAILGGSPLPLNQLLLRYCLTSLAAMGLGAAYARRRLQLGIWDGATGAVAALIALAAGLSLLHGRAVAFPLGPLELPAWVLFLSYGALQLRWLLPRLDGEQGSTPGQRLLRSSWCWGSCLGFGWALQTRVAELLAPLLR